MSKLIAALFETLMFFAVAGLVITEAASLAENPDATATQITLIGLVGVIFFLGGTWSIASIFGLVQAPSSYVRSRFSRS